MPVDESSMCAADAVSVRRGGAAARPGWQHPGTRPHRYMTDHEIYNRIYTAAMWRSGCCVAGRVPPRASVDGEQVAGAPSLSRCAHVGESVAAAIVVIVVRTASLVLRPMRLLLLLLQRYVLSATAAVSVCVFRE